jgi:hypothetical protein
MKSLLPRASTAVSLGAVLLAAACSPTPPPSDPGTGGAGGAPTAGRGNPPLGTGGTGGSGEGGTGGGGAGGTGGTPPGTGGSGGAGGSGPVDPPPPPAPKPDAGGGAPGDAPPAGMLPTGMFGPTGCLNADGTGGRPTYDLIDSVLGARAVEHNPDMDHTPPFEHVQEDTDAEVGPHFVFFAHYPQDNDGAPGDDRSRVEIKVNTGAAAGLRGQVGDTMTYSWRFKIDPGMQFSNRFTHLHQIKSFGGNEGAPVITITATAANGNTNENLRIDHWGDGTETTTLIRVPLTGLKGVWLEVTERILVSDNGSIAITIKKPDGTTVVDVTRAGLDFWRQGEYIRGKWGIYRGKDDQLRTGEDKVRFANFAITKGTATPTTTCR